MSLHPIVIEQRDSVDSGPSCPRFQTLRKNFRGNFDVSFLIGCAACLSVERGQQSHNFVAWKGSVKLPELAEPELTVVEMKACVSGNTQLLCCAKKKLFAQWNRAQRSIEGLGWTRLRTQDLIGSVRFHAQDPQSLRQETSGRLWGPQAPFISLVHLILA